MVCSFWLIAGFALAAPDDDAKQGSSPATVTVTQAREELDRSIKQLGIPDKYAQREREYLEQRINQGTPIERTEYDQFLQVISDFANIFTTARISRGHPTEQQRQSMQRSAENLFNNNEGLKGFGDLSLQLTKFMARNDNSPEGVVRKALEHAVSKFAREQPE